MKLTKNQKHEILKSFLRIISKITDKKYQKHAWIEGNASDFEEFVCLFFDLVDPILDKYEDYSISRNQYKLLKRFRDEFEAFADKNSQPSGFIETSEWARIIKKALQVLKSFNFTEAE